MKGHLIALGTVALLTLVGRAAADYGYGGYSNGSGGYSSDSSSKVGQNNTGYSAASGGSYSARTYYEPYYYWYCGRRYVGYRAVSVPSTPPVVNNPVGAVNTDNSVAYHYEYNITYSQQPQQQGSTLYGYSTPYPNPLSASTYQNTDLAVLDQYVRLQSDSQGYLNEGHNRTSERMKELMTLAQIQTAGQTQTAEILAKGMAVAEVTKANAAATAATANALKSDGAIMQTKTTVVQGNGQPVVVKEGTVTTQNGQTTYGPAVQPPTSGAKPVAPSPATAVLAAKTTQIFNQKCTKCHNPQTLKGNLDLTNLKNITPEQVEKILSRVVDTDPLRRMPLADDGTAGQPLPMEDVKTLFAAAGKQ